MESVPSDGPTVRSCAYSMLAGSAPVPQHQRQIARFLLGRKAVNAALIADGALNRQPH